MFWTNWNYHCLGWSHTSTLGQHSWPIGFKEHLKSFFSKYLCVKIGLIVAKPYPCGSRFQNTWNIAVKEDFFCLHIRMLTNDPFPLSIVVPTYPRGSHFNKLAFKLPRNASTQYHWPIGFNVECVKKYFLNVFLRSTAKVSWSKITAAKYTF